MGKICDITSLSCCLQQEKKPTVLLLSSYSEKKNVMYKKKYLNRVDTLAKWDITVSELDILAQVGNDILHQ